MHELALAQSIIDAIETQAAKYNAARVTGIRLRVGEASGILLDSLTYSVEMLASLNPLLKQLQLSVDVVPHQAHCHACAQEFHIADFVPCCPTCGQWSSEIVSGTELQLLEMEFEAAPVTPH